MDQTFWQLTFFYSVYGVDADGRRTGNPQAVFSTQSLAEKYIEDKFGNSWSYKIATEPGLIIFKDSLLAAAFLIKQKVDLDLKESDKKEKLKAQALAKLTEEEKEALGV